jgi:hypothetical protein
MLVVEVRAQLHEKDDHPIMLGSFMFTLNEIEQIFLRNDVWVTKSKTLSDVGSIEISARRQRADTSFILQKERESILGLTRQVDSVRKFNEDADLPAYATMSGNVKGIGGVSLLHAAIQLVDTADLINKLLYLNADPHAQSIVGTPLEVAEKSFARSKEQLECSQVDGTPDEVIDMHRHRYLQASKIRELFRTTLKGGQNDEECTLQNGDEESGSRQARLGLLDTNDKL